MKLSRSSKVLLSLGSLGVAATIAGTGTFATFSDTHTAAQSISAGTVAVTLGTTSFSSAISNMAPGDTVQKRFELDNTGSLDLHDVTLTGTALSGVGGSGSEMFVGTPATSDALQVKIERCAAGWSGSAGSYTCTGSAQTVLAQTKASGATGTLSNLALGTGASGTNDLVMTYSLPGTADNFAQGDSGTLTYTLVATQRNASNS